MFNRKTFAPVAALMLLSSLPTATRAQHATVANPPAVTAGKEATQFDFLVGQWQLTVMPKVNSLAARIHGAPRMAGTWKAWRAFDGFGVEDELRIVDGSGNPASLSHAMRLFSATDKHWIVSGLDVYRARTSAATAQWNNGEMQVSGSGVDAEGSKYLTRSRFFAITKDKFSFAQDRSTDNGKTWDEDVLKIEAKRVAASAPR